MSLSVTFMLRGVDPKQVVDKYANGDFSDVSSVAKQIIKAKKLKLNVKTGNNSLSGRFYINNINNKLQLTITTNHEWYTLAINKNKNGKYDIKQPAGLCLWCRRHSENPLGCPVKIERINSKMTVFHTVDRFCCFGCMKAYVDERVIVERARGLKYYSECLVLIYTMFNKCYPGDSLKSSPFWADRKANGGPLEDDEFFCGTKEYIQSPNYITLPAKRIILVNDNLSI